MSRKLLVIAVMLFVPLSSRAQTSSDSAAYKRAQTLVNDGNVVAGRAVVDSMIARATPGTNQYAEGIYWRAVLSATAADAEMDYRRIIVDYPLSPRVEDVLLRLAQLELARADYDGALQHLNRLTFEHPTGISRARAGYWAARVLFEKNDVQRACAVNADALASTTDNDTEIRNQISYLNQRCAGVVLVISPPGASDTVRVLNAPALPTPAGSSVAVLSSPIADKPQVVSRTAETEKQDLAPKKPRMPPPATPRDAKPSIVDPAREKTASNKSPDPKTSSARMSASESKAEAGGYSVQIAAYNVKAQAERMAAKLEKKGYQARVSGTSAPYRVRIGHYASEAQAAAVMRSLKAKQIDGFVVKAETR